MMDCSEAAVGHCAFFGALYLQNAFTIDLRLSTPSAKSPLYGSVQDCHRTMFRTLIQIYLISVKPDPWQTISRPCFVWVGSSLEHGSRFTYAVDDTSLVPWIINAGIYVWRWECRSEVLGHDKYVPPREILVLYIKRVSHELIVTKKH